MVRLKLSGYYPYFNYLSNCSSYDDENIVLHIVMIVVVIVMGMAMPMVNVYVICML